MLGQDTYRTHLRYHWVPLGTRLGRSSCLLRNLFSFPFWLRFHLAPHLTRDAARLDDVRSCKVGVTLRHLDVRVTKQFRELVEIAARHHVPGRKGVAQIVEPEVSNAGSCENILEAPFSLCLPLRSPLVGGKMRSSPIAAGYRRISSASSYVMGT